MAEERIYTIPLRKAFMKAPSYKRSAKAISAIRKFLIKHMKTEDVKIGKYLNLEIFKHGRKNPPPRVKVKAVKDKIKVKDKEVEIVKAELIDAPVEKEERKQEIKKEEKVAEIKETEENMEKLEKEKKEVLEHAALIKKERKTKSFMDKTKPTQEQKISGIIGSTGK